MAEVGAARDIALEGYVRAQWISAELGGGRVETTAGARRVMFRDPVVRPDWVYPGRHDAQAWEAASGFVRDSQASRRPCLLVVDDAADRSLEDQAVSSLGLSPTDTVRCMALHPTAEQAPPPAREVTLDVVEDEEGRQALLEASAAIFEAPLEMFELLYPPGMLGSDAARAVLARVDGALAGVAAAFVADGAVGVYGVATAVPFRRRGIGEVLTSWAVGVGLREGSRLAYLQPSDMGRALYERMGFRDVGGYRRYLHRPE